MLRYAQHDITGVLLRKAHECHVVRMTTATFQWPSLFSLVSPQQGRTPSNRRSFLSCCSCSNLFLLCPARKQPSLFFGVCRSDCRPTIRNSLAHLSGFARGRRRRHTPCSFHGTPAVGGQGARKRGGRKDLYRYEEVSTLHATVALAPPISQSFRNGGAVC